MTADQLNLTANKLNSLLSSQQLLAVYLPLPLPLVSHIGLTALASTCAAAGVSTAFTYFFCEGSGQEDKGVVSIELAAVSTHHCCAP